MAGTGRKVWAADEILAAADLQNYIQDQTVMRYANATARTSGILSPTEGMVTYLDDANALYVYDGSAWVAVVADGSITAAKLASNAVTTIKILDANVTNAKLATGIDAGKVTTGTLPAAQLPTIPTSSLGTGNWNMGAATLTTINVTASGVVSAGDFSSSGTLTANGGMTSTSVYNQTNTGRAMYVASNGLFGIGSSSERFKQNIVDANLDPNILRRIAVRLFEYREDFGGDGSLQIGVIAEELVALGLDQFVFFNEDGTPDGVAYEKLALAALSLVQAQADRLDSIEARLVKLEK